MSQPADVFSGALQALIARGYGAANALLFGWNAGNDYSASHYYPPTIPDAVYASGASALVADYVIYVPFICRFTHTFTKLAFYNTGAGDSGDLIRMGIYDSTGGRPVNRLVDGGELTMTGAAAVNEATISQQLIAGRLHFLAITANGAITGYRVAGAVTGAWRSALDLGALTTATLPDSIGFAESRAYAALPATA